METTTIKCRGPGKDENDNLADDTFKKKKDVKYFGHIERHHSY